MPRSREKPPPLIWLAHGLQSFGIDVERMPLSKDQRAWLVKRDPRVPAPLFDDYLEILNQAGRFSGEGEIGLRLAEHINDHELGVLGYILLNVASIGDFLEMATRYHTTLSTYTAAYFHRGQFSSRFSHEVLVPAIRSPKHDITLTLSRRVDFIRNHIGPDWLPASACFSFRQPANVEPYVMRFGHNILFNQALNFFEIDNTFLEVAINDSDPQLLDIIRVQADDLLERMKNGDDLVGRVKMQLINRIGQTDASQERIARALNVSRATLQRRLAAKGKSFRQLRDEIVYELSTSALAETDATIGEIALQMGYSELSSFDRGFSRLSGGLTPKEYRRQFRRTA